jgi:hypothetical protein
MAGTELDMLADTHVAGRAETLEGLRATIGDCQRCKLCSGRTNIVFGVGHPQAKLMFVGEGPGRDEDLKGEPFVGRAGQLLTDIITKGMGLKRDDVYRNVVKCRPENRNPGGRSGSLRTVPQNRSTFVPTSSSPGRIRRADLSQQGADQQTARRLGGYRHRSCRPFIISTQSADKKLVWEDIKKSE